MKSVRLILSMIAFLSLLTFLSFLLFQKSDSCREVNVVVLDKKSSYKIDVAFDSCDLQEYHLPDSMIVSVGDILFFRLNISEAQESESDCEYMDLLRTTDTAYEKENGIQIYKGTVKKIYRCPISGSKL